MKMSVLNRLNPRNGIHGLCHKEQSDDKKLPRINPQLKFQTLMKLAHFQTARDTRSCTQNPRNKMFPSCIFWEACEYWVRIADKLGRFRFCNLIQINAQIGIHSSQPLALRLKTDKHRWPSSSSSGSRWHSTGRRPHPGASSNCPLSLHKSFDKVIPSLESRTWAATEGRRISLNGGANLTSTAKPCPSGGLGFGPCWSG